MPAELFPVGLGVSQAFAHRPRLHARRAACRSFRLRPVNAHSSYGSVASVTDFAPGGVSFACVAHDGVPNRVFSWGELPSLALASIAGTRLHVHGSMFVWRCLLSTGAREATVRLSPQRCLSLML